MKFRTTGYALLTVIVTMVTTVAAEPQLTLYLPFDGDISAKVAGGDGQFRYQAKGEEPQFAKGIKGQGFVTGGNSQYLSVPAEGYLSPDEWSITFWIKGLPNAGWNGGEYLENFWTLSGENGGMMQLYHYRKRPSPWLYSRKDKDSEYMDLLAPAVPEQDWHFWAVTWRSGSGAYLYVDGQLVGQSPTSPPDLVKTLIIGQGKNQFSPPEPNKIIDEFKIYDGVLDGGAIARQYWEEGARAFKAQLSVSPAAQMIEVDGQIDEQEWAGAAGFSGLLGEFTQHAERPQTKGKISYDDQHLYVALRSDNPAEVLTNPDVFAARGLFKEEATQHDGDVENDDSFYIALSPRPGQTYQLYINALGVIADSVLDNGGKADKSWDSGAVVHNVVNDEGWDLEVAIPFTSLGISSISDGEQWGANFGRIWKMLRQGKDQWSPSNEGTITFGRAVSTQVSHFAIADDGQIQVELILRNDSSAAQALQAGLTVSDTELDTQDVVLSPKETQKVVLSGSGQKLNGALAQVIVKNGEQVLLLQSQPIILQQVGQLLLWSYPSLHQIRLGWEIYRATEAQHLSLEARIEADGKVVKTLNLPHLPSLKGSQLVDVEELEPAAYTIKIEVKEGDELVQEQSIVYEKTPLPAWLGNTYGISDTPAPPWTNVEVDKIKEVISIWGRDYHFGGALFPRQIVNQGKEMLAAPMRLVVKRGESTSRSDGGDAAVNWTETSAICATSIRNQRLEQVELSSNSYVEFDGMNWTDLTVTPKGSSVLLDELTLEIPLKSEWAELINPRNDRHLQNTGRLAAEGWKGSANDMPWVGNGDGGFQVFQESTTFWSGSKTIEVIPGAEGETIIKVHFIDTPTTLEEPLELGFGWTVSPVRPAGKHRDYRFVSGGALQRKAPGVAYLESAVAKNPNLKAWVPWWSGWWWLPEGYVGVADHAGFIPVPKPNLKESERVTQLEGIQVKHAPYFRLTGQVGTDNPWFAQFGDEWVPTSDKITSGKGGKAYTTFSQNSASLRDFYLWGLHELMERSQAESVYYDVSRIYPDSNLYHGAGVELPDETIEPTWNIRGMREVMRRIYTLVKERHPEGKVFYHMSGEPLLPLAAFSDFFVDGENYTLLLDRKENRGYEKVLSMDQFRAEYSAQNNFGPPTVIIPQFERMKSILPDEWEEVGYHHADYLIGMSYLHNSHLWWTNMPYHYLAKMDEAIDNSGLNGEWTFTPYWHQQYLSLPEGVFLSLYESPDKQRVLLIMMNHSGQDQEISLPMTWGKSDYKEAKLLLPEEQVLSGALRMSNHQFKAVLLSQ